MAYPRVTEIKTIIVEQCNERNPLFLRWLNPLGYFDSWLFGTRQVIARDITNGELFEPYIPYLNEANGIQQVLQKTAFEIRRLGAEGLTVNDIEGIQWLLSSPFVFIMTADGNGWKRTNIVVREGSFQIMDNFEALHEIEFEIVMPKLLVQSV